MSLNITQIPNDFKTSLPPRKKAKTDEEKEQRRIERILRNRRAAHKSREKKRNQLKYLSVKCDLLVKMLGCVDGMGLRELDDCEEYVKLRREYEQFTSEVQTSEVQTSEVQTSEVSLNGVINSTTPDSIDMDAVFNTCSSSTSLSSTSLSPDIKIECNDDDDDDNTVFDNFVLNSGNNNLLMDDNMIMEYDDNSNNNSNNNDDTNNSNSNNNSGSIKSEFTFDFQQDDKDNLFFTDDNLFLSGLDELSQSSGSYSSSTYNQVSDIERYPAVITFKKCVLWRVSKTREKYKCLV
ncbi:hypothetical protein ACO0QE_003114 [Hanseniaspora vineae]